MASQEFTPEVIGQSMAHIEEVRRYVKGERVLPLQNPDLEQKYVDAIARYFKYTQQTLTEPEIVDFVQRSGVGAWRGDGAPHLVVLQKGVHLISKGSYLRGNFANMACLMTEAAPRLVYCTETTLYPRHVSEDLREDTIKQKITEWEENVKEVCASDDDHADWVFGHGYSNQYKDYLYLYAYRTMGASDLLFSDNLPTFVNGISRTFASLKRSAEEESAVSFNGVQDIAKIKSITEAFNQANGILEKMFNPDAPTSIRPLQQRTSRRRVRG